MIEEDYGKFVYNKWGMFEFCDARFLWDDSNNFVKSLPFPIGDELYISGLFEARLEKFLWKMFLK
jgi:hypothetical protein